MSGWPVTFAQSLDVAMRYGLARQYRDAEVEFLRAASIARSLGRCDDETEMLASAWFARTLANTVGREVQSRPEHDPRD